MSDIVQTIINGGMPSGLTLTRRNVPTKRKHFLKVITFMFNYCRTRQVNLEGNSVHGIVDELAMRLGSSGSMGFDLVAPLNRNE